MAVEKTPFLRIFLIFKAWKEGTPSSDTENKSQKGGSLCLFQRTRRARDGPWQELPGGWHGEHSTGRRDRRGTCP